MLGDRVVAAVSQPGGFSPGTADRIVTAGGRRAFVKAASAEQNVDSAVLHRREARIAAGLPSGTPAPRLYDVYDDGTWVALLFEDVDGRHPMTPWRPDERDLVLDALAQLAVVLTPCPVPNLPTAVETLARFFDGWQAIAAALPDDLDPWARTHLTEIAGLADRAISAVSGDTLVHTDVRADNVLLRQNGTVVIVDWPWGCRGCTWFDTFLLLFNVRFYGADDVEKLFASRAPLATAEDLTAVLAGIAGFLLDQSRRSPPPGLPKLRAFQRAQADVAMRWLHDRW